MDGLLLGTFENILQEKVVSARVGLSDTYSADSYAEKATLSLY